VNPAVPLQVQVVTEVTAELVEAFARLMPQHSANPTPLGPAELQEIITTPRTVMLVARITAGGPIVGTATLVVFRIPSGLRARLESVVVDAAARGQGVGEALCRAVLDHARAAGAPAVDLTCVPARAAANRLYQRLGFQRRETNVYRLTFPR